MFESLKFVKSSVRLSLVLTQNVKVDWSDLKPAVVWSHSLLGEEVSVGAAVLHGDAVAFAAHAVSRHGDGAVVVRQRCVLQHRHVPQEGVGTLLRLPDRAREKKLHGKTLLHDESTTKTPQQVHVGVKLLDDVESTFPLAREHDLKSEHQI